jgi:sugar phosphate isomerase/epimerase
MRSSSTILPCEPRRATLAVTGPWKEFFSVVRMVGYNGWVSLEMEDFTMSTDAGAQTSVDALLATISR